MFFPTQQIGRKIIANGLMKKSSFRQQLSTASSGKEKEKTGPTKISKEEMGRQTTRKEDVVIIGGGVIGSSVAYNLTKQQQQTPKDAKPAKASKERGVLVLEKNQLTEGCTWHAAGLVGQLRKQQNLSQLMQHSVAIFDSLHEATEGAVSWKKVGSLRLASTNLRWQELLATAAAAQQFGLRCELVSASAACELFEGLLSPLDIHGAVWVPTDGYIDPYSLTHAYARIAKSMGARFQEGSCVVEVFVDRDSPETRQRVLGVRTSRGEVISCDTLVNCAGLWAKRVADLCGLAIATSIVEHQYFLTEKKLSLPPTLPTLRDPDNNFYLKPDTGAFAIGGWEDGSQGFHAGLPPFSFGRELLQPNFERLEKFAVLAANRIPLLSSIGIQTVINGPIPVSADGEPLIGAAPKFENLFLACGFTAGIAASGGAGLALSNLILHNDPGIDMTPWRPDRFSIDEAEPLALEKKAIEVYGSYYKLKK